MNNQIGIYVAIIALMYFLFWGAIEAGAQIDPYPTEVCWVDETGELLCTSGIAATLTPFVPTSTPQPPPVGMVWLPVVRK